MTTAPHTYINGELVWAGDLATYVGLPGTTAILRSPSLLQGWGDLPSRIYWAGKPIDIVDGRIKGMTQPCVMSHQVGRALKQSGFMQYIKGGHQVRRAIRKAQLSAAIEAPQKSLQTHPLAICPAPSTTLIALQWLPALCDQIADPMAWALGDHIRDIHPRCVAAFDVEDEAVLHRQGRQAAKPPVAERQAAKPPVAERQAAPEPPAPPSPPPEAIPEPSVTIKVEALSEPPPEPTPPGGSGAVPPPANDDEDRDDLGTAFTALVRRAFDGTTKDDAGHRAAEEVERLRADLGEERAAREDLEARVAELEAFVNALKGVGIGRAA